MWSPVEAAVRADAPGSTIVHKYNQLMKDFPLNELLSAADLDKVKDSLHLIFGHINKKLKVS